MDLRAAYSKRELNEQQFTSISNNKIEEILKEALFREGRKEALSWALDSFSSLELDLDNVEAETSSSSSTQRFAERLLLNVPFRDVVLTKALLGYFCEYNAEKVVELISSSSSSGWREFFLSDDDDDERKKAFFQSNFRFDGEHLKGAKAICSFSLRRRNTHWHHLRWRNNKSQSPVICATKPGTFCELDCVQTLRGSLGEDDEFWSSEEFMKSLKRNGGEDAKVLILSDIEYFVSILYGKLSRTSSTDDNNFSELRSYLFSFLKKQNHLITCQKLLPFISNETDVLKLANNLFTKKDECKSLLGCVFAGVEWQSVEDFVLAIALTFRARIFAQILKDCNNEEILKQEIVFIDASKSKLNIFCQFFIARLKLNANVLDIEEVMRKSGIEFKRVALEYIEDFEDDEDSVQSIKKSKKKRKKRKLMMTTTKNKGEEQLNNEDMLQWRIIGDGDDSLVYSKNDLVDVVLERFIVKACSTSDA